MPAITLNDKNKYFYLNDGRAFKSVKELADALRELPKEVFEHHVSDKKNDFADWIKAVFKEEHLSVALKKVHTRKQTYDLLKRFVDKGHFVHETVIIGGGIAGMSAALYAARKRMDYLIISPDFGGQMTVAGEIENWPGQTHTNWEKFMADFKEQMESNEIKFVEEKVTEIKKLDDGHFNVVTDKAKYETETVIVCSGARARKLKVPGEDKYDKKGLTYCAICDGPLFKGRTVAVIGGGDAALESAEFLLRIVEKIYLITINEKMTGHEYLLERVLGQEKVEVIGNAKTKEILGDKMVTGIKIEQNGKERKIDLGGVFVEIGRIPDSGIVKGLCEIDKDGHIVVDKNCQTSVEDVYAAGDVSDIHEYQFSISAGQAVTALLKAARSIAKKS